MPDHWPVFTGHCERKNLLPAKHPPSTSVAETMQMPWMRADDVLYLGQTRQWKGVIVHTSSWDLAWLGQRNPKEKMPPPILFTFNWMSTELTLGNVPPSPSNRGIKFGKHQKWKQVPHICWGAEIQFLHGQKSRLNITNTQTCRLL